jgi:hypothetical protein
MIFRCIASSVMLVAGLFSGCISRTHDLPKDQILLAADTMSKSALLERLKGRSLSVQTLVVKQSTLKPSQLVSGEAIKDYADVKGKIAVDRPAQLRLEIEKIVTVAQMVSDGKTYKVYINPKGKFGVGDVSAPVQDAEFPYNLRPSHLLDALFVDGEAHMGKAGIDTFVTEYTESHPDGIHSFYRILFGKVGGVPLEELLFDRTLGVMEVVQKKTFLPDGRVEADILYSDFGIFSSIPFPRKIVIKRPIENYSLEVLIEQMELNNPVNPSMFVLNRPQGVDDVDLNTGKDIIPK